MNKCELDCYKGWDVLYPQISSDASFAREYKIFTLRLLILVANVCLLSINFLLFSLVKVTVCFS